MAGLEARFTQPSVYGVTLLDRLGLGAPCSVVLTVYEDDGVTPLWEVSTDPDHPYPYLIDPDQYAEQQIDVAQGGARLGTVSVAVIDPANIPGDQDGGWLTARLASTGLADLAGRRCRLVRYISTTLGWQVIADGPAGTPSMDPSYAAFIWAIRDTRETERKTRIFQQAGSEPTGLRSLIPDELMEGYGYDADSNTYLLRPAMPLKAHANRHAFYPTPGVATFRPFGPQFTPVDVYPEQVNRRLIWEESQQAIIDGIGRAAVISSTLLPNLDFAFRWRAMGSSDEWTEIPGSVLGVGIRTRPSDVTSDVRVVEVVAIEDHRLNPSSPHYDPDAPAMPTEDQEVEFYLIGAAPTSERHPVVIDSKLVPGVAGPLSPGADLLLARFNLVSTSGSYSGGLLDLLALPGNVEEIRRQTVTVFNRLGNESTTGDIFIPSRGLFRWRAAGSSDPWTEFLLEPADPGGASALVYIATPLLQTYRVFTLVNVTALTADLPAHGDDIEFTIEYQVGDPELDPLLVGVTAGQLVKNVYDGLYAPRGPNGELVPMKVRYDEAALLQMTDPIRLRLTEPVDDARDWLEKAIYAPTGWFPALDSDGAVSPLHQAVPTGSTGLPVLDNAITEPTTDWNAGDRVVNVVRYAYNRDFVYEDDDPGAYPDTPRSEPPDPTEERQKVVKAQPIVLEDRDEASIARFGEQLVDLSGLAFTAIGTLPDQDAEAQLPPVRVNRPRGFQLAVQPVTATPVVRTGAYVQPISGNISDEASYLLFQDRSLQLWNRYAFGAPTVRLTVMRSAIPLLRAGDWVLLDLSWLPDYVTQRRGLLAIGQVVALGDLDCAWRHPLIEMVVPLEGESG